MSEAINTLKIGHPAPNFKVPAYFPSTDKVEGEIELGNYLGKWVLLFFYPLDFTFVCPTELIKLADMATEFEEENCQILSTSIDSVFSHQAWLKQDSRLKNLKFPMLSDLSKNLGSAYGILNDEGVHLRGTFLIDPEGILKSFTVNDPAVGRNPKEFLRTLRAFKTGDLCPVNWEKGENTLGKA